MPIDCLISISRFLTPCSAFAFQLSRTPTSPAPFAYEWPFTPVSGASWPLARPPPPQGEGQALARPPNRRKAVAVAKALSSKRDAQAGDPASPHSNTFPDCVVQAAERRPGAPKPRAPCEHMQRTDTGGLRKTSVHWQLQQHMRMWLAALWSDQWALACALALGLWLRSCEYSLGTRLVLGFSCSGEDFRPADRRFSFALGELELKGGLLRIWPLCPFFPNWSPSSALRSVVQ
jgi:hypothetical protein